MTGTRSRASTGSTDYVRAYARAVESGREIAGPHVRAACARHLRDLKDGRGRGLRFDKKAANRAQQFFPEILRLAGGQFEGLPFKLEPPQQFIVGSLFGWKRADGLRRFRTAYIEAGKGNGKSPLLAGIGLYGLAADNEARAEVYSAATKRDQAMVLFRDAVAMVQQSPELASRLRMSGRDEKVWNIYSERTGSWFRPLASDERQSGPRPHFGLVDELHEHRTGLMVNMLAAGRKWRRQPMTVIITNAGFDRSSVCWEYHEKAIRVAAGMDADDTFFSYVCALDEGDEPLADEYCWRKANPLLGTTITEQYLRDEVSQARGMPSKESMVRRLNFCQWTEASSPAIPYEAWRAAVADFTLEDFRGGYGILGIDLSATMDLTACVLVFERDGLYYTWPLFFIPEDGLAERVRRDNVPYDIWVREGQVFTTPGKAIDKDFVVDRVEQVLATYEISLLAAPYDRHRIDVLQAALDRVGASWPLVKFGQGFISMGPAVDALETALINGHFRHPDNPCLNWNAANAVSIANPVGDRKFDKSRATGRIDGMVACAMALREATRIGQAEVGSMVG
jgi:phage terminase large subunit-like protein